MLKTAVVLLLAAAAIAVPVAALAQESLPEAPQGVQLHIRDGGALISWLPVEGADTYEVRKAFCESPDSTDCTLARTTETTWQDPSTVISEDGYLVAACDDSGCGKAVQPVLVDDRPDAPEQVTVEQTPDGIMVSWAPVEGATEYQVIYDDRLSRLCHLGWPDQELLQCDEAGRTTDTEFLHRDAARLQARYYWVAACNQAGCRKGKGKGAEIGDPTAQAPQEPEATTTPVTGPVVGKLTLSSQNVREGENFTATLEAQAPPGGPGTLELRLSADGPLHLTAVAGQESCGPGCVSLSHPIEGGGRGSLSASFTAGQRGSARLLWSASWEPDGPGEARENTGGRTLVVLAGQDSPGAVIQSGGAGPPSTVPPTAPPAPLAPSRSGSGGCNFHPESGTPGSPALLGLLILPMVGLVRRPLLSRDRIRERPQRRRTIRR